MQKGGIHVFKINSCIVTVKPTIYPGLLVANTTKSGIWQQAQKPTL